MRRAFVAISKTAFNLLYRVRCRTRRQDEVVFLSRQANEPSFDFSQLALEFEERGWKTTMHLKKVTKRNLVSYVGHVLKEIGLVARCKIVILDRYDPVISLIDFACEQSETPARPDVHDEFPTEPMVIQLWHAFGAYKKFGYQSIGTREGHSREVIDAFNIHRNYSWIVCSGEGCRKSFAEAFSYPVARVVALDRPEYHELVDARRRHDAETASLENNATIKPFVILMAPTLRKSKSSKHPFRELFEHADDFAARLSRLTQNVPVQLVWTFHPLEEGLPASGNASEALMEADCVVTDYSSIVYEAYLLGKPVVFYVPDLKSYLASPGLNINPQETCPLACADDETQLAKIVAQIAQDPSSYPAEELEAFAAPAFSHGQKDSPQNVVDFALTRIGRCATT